MKISEIMNFPILEGDVGLEIECEGNIPELRGDKIWKQVHDGSLRNGIEFIYRRPLPVDEVKDSLIYLNNKMEEAKALIDFSFRTSVHVHVNCLGLEYKHVLNYVYIYLLLESLLVEYCGEGRKCNRFCLRLEDADGAADLLIPMFSSSGTKNTIQMLAQDQLRYASINVQALSKFGSVEFRAMRGTMDHEILVPWVETLVHMRDFATGFDSPKAVYELVNDAGPDSFFKDAIGKHWEKFDNGDVGNSIMRGQSLTVELPFIEPKIKWALTEENKHKEYRYGGGTYSLQFLFEHFGGELPGAVEIEFERQDKNRNLEVAPGFNLFDEILPGVNPVEEDDEEEHRDGEEGEEDEW